MDKEIKFIAELGDTHYKNIEKIKRLITAAKQAGCWAVKFQLYNPDSLWHLSLPDWVGKAKQNALPKEFIPIISYFCNENNIKFGCSVFDLENVDYLAKYCDYLKVASYEFMWSDLIKKCLSTKLPLHISTGLCNEEEVLSFAEMLHQYPPYIQKQAIIYHCVSNYPTNNNECNLSVLSEYKKMFPSSKIGWSDHTTKKIIVSNAVAIGADVIELHFCEENDGWQQAHFWESTKVAEVIEDIKTGMQAIGDKTKKPVGREFENRSYRADPSDGIRLLKEYR